MSQEIIIRVKKDSSAEGLPLPGYQTEGSAGADIAASEEAVIEPGGRYLVRTGLYIEVPEGYEAQLRPRSGLASKHGLTLLNSPGTIDSDYRGEVKVLMINHGREPFVVKRGERIAQMVIAPVTRAVFKAAEALSSTERSGGGFGSTGV